MPTTGYKSITIPEHLYDQFRAHIGSDDVKNDVGAYSLSKFVSDMLEERMMKDRAIAHNSLMLRKIGIDGDRAILRDRKSNRVAEVVIKDHTLYCESCESEECLHCGFCYALPEVYTVMKNTGSTPQ